MIESAVRARLKALERDLVRREAAPTILELSHIANKQNGIPDTDIPYADFRDRTFARGLLLLLEAIL